MTRFELSRDGRYIAYAVVIDSTDEGGVYEPGDMVPKVAVTQVVVATLPRIETVKTIRPSSDLFVGIDHWSADGLLILYTGGDFDVSEWFSYDPVSGETRTYEGDAEYVLAMRSDEAPDRQLRASEVDGSIRLDNLKTGVSRVLVANGCDGPPVFSPDASKLAFIEVADWDRATAQDRLWVVDIADGVSRQVAAIPIQGWGRGNAMWSPDGRHVMMPWGVVVAENDSTIRHSLSGGEFTWLDSRTVLVSRVGNIDAYRLDTRSTTRFLDNAANIRVAPR